MARTRPSAAYDGITEIWLDSFADFHRFFATENDLTKVHPDEGAFLDLASVVVMVTNETVMKRALH